jgi:hypothetical protein
VAAATTHLSISNSSEVSFYRAANSAPAHTGNRRILPSFA